MMKRYLLVFAVGIISVCAHALTPQRLSLQSAKLSKKVNTLKADSIVPAYITVDAASLDRDALASLGVKINMDLGNTLTARVPAGVIVALSAIEGVRYVQVSTPVRSMLDVARPETGINVVNEGKDLDQPYTGKGVIVGIVDSGFDYGHAAFKDADGNLRIKRVWEQSSEPTEGLYSPARFGYGVEFCDAEAILKAGGDIRNNSHGTHVVSLAAGSDSYLDGMLHGMAPEAEIVLVSMVEAGGGNVNISDAIAYIFDYADEMDKPCVINLSLGSNSGPHDGTSTFDQIADRMQGPGRLIIGASGNGRGTLCHLRKEFASDDESPLRTFIEYKGSISDKNKDDEVELWADGNIEMDLIVYKFSTNEIVERVKVYSSIDPVEPSMNVSLGRNVSGSYLVDSEVNPLNNKVHVMLTSEVTSIRTGYGVAVEVRPLQPCVVDMWSESALITFVSRGVEGFSEASEDESTVCEIGGTAKRILTVGAYTTRSEFMKLGDTSFSKLNETDGDVCSFSGNGPTADGRVKPQICAPGCYISGALSSFDHSGTQVYSAYHDGYDHENYYGYMQGTSMATPIVSGIVATWLEAWSEMTPEDLLEVVSMSARTDEFTGDLALPNNDWGYGKIDALAGVRECIIRSGHGGVADVKLDNSVPFKLLTGDSGALSLLFSDNAENLTVDIYSLLGAQLVHKYCGDISASDIIDLDLSTLHQGIYILNVNTSTSKHSIKFIKR